MSESASENTGAAPVHTEQSHEAIARVERASALATLAITREEERSKHENDEKHEQNSASIDLRPEIRNLVKLRVGEVLFEVEKETLLRVPNTYFHGLLSSGAWQPDADGVYSIDRPAMGFDRILDYLSSGKLSVEGLSELEEECIYSNLEYFLIPPKRQYYTRSAIEGFKAHLVCQLKGGRLCGVSGVDIIVWNMDTSAIEMTLKGHISMITEMFQLQDGRVCSCSHDKTVKLWSIASGLCELTLTGHTKQVMCIIQLFDGRLCSGSMDKTFRVWNISTGICEAALQSQHAVLSIAQLDDGRVCGGGGSHIYIYSLLTGECELSWEGHNGWIGSIVCIDATRICSCSIDNTIKVWNIATGECERTLEEHTDQVMSMVLMQDGRLCSASLDGTLKLWNLETGQCESTLSINDRSYGVLQLEDGRLLCSCYSGTVAVWS